MRPASSDSRPQAAPRPPTGQPRPRGRPGRRVFPLALGASALLHVLLFVYMYVTVLRPPQGSTGPAEAAPARLDEGVLEVVRVRPVAGEPRIEPEDEDERRAVPVPERARVRYADPDAPAQADAAQPAPRRSRLARPLERLQPRMSDERLWEERGLPYAPEQSDHARMEERVAQRLGAWNDSIAAAEADAARAKDWTIKGENGERWGISSEGIHLGTVTLPAPTFAGTAEARARDAEWHAIQGQADRARIHDRFDERVRALRERRDQERAAKKGNGGGS